MIQFDSSLIGSIATLFDKLIQARAAIWVGKILSALGLGFVAQEFLYDPLIDQAAQYWHAVPSIVARWIHALGIDTGVSIVFSAYGIRGVERVFLSRRDSQP